MKNLKELAHRPLFNRCHLGLYLVIDASQRSKQIALQAVRGGVTMVQLREKETDIAVVRERALELKALLAPLSIPLIINDFVELAAETEADGVHLGQSDMHPDEARKILGPSKIIGLSIESLSDLTESRTMTSVDYIAAGAVYPSKTKPDCKKLWGLDGLKTVVNRANHPVVAIGGIKLNNVKMIMKTGVDGISVVGAIHDFPDPLSSALKLRAEVDKYISRNNGVCI